MYIINTIPHGKCFGRYLRTRYFCIRNRTSERSERVRFLIRQQLVRKYRTPALSMKYSLYFNKGLADKFQKNQNRAAGILTFSTYEVCSIVLLDEFGWERLEYVRLKQLALTMYKIYNDLSLSYLKWIFTKYTLPQS